MSDFDWTILQRDKLWIEKFTTRQLFTWTLCTVSDFAENFGFMKSRLFSFSAVEMAGLAVFVYFKRLHLECFRSIVSDTDIKNLQRLRFGNEKYTTSQVSDELSYNVSMFELKCLQRARLWNKGCAACQISNWKLYKMSDLEEIFDKGSRFDYDKWQGVWFWSEIFTTRQTLEWKFIQRVRFYV